MELRYMGFNQRQNTRVFSFQGIAKGKPTIRFEVTADMALFLKHHIAIQEGPALCAEKLTADLNEQRPGRHALTNEDLLTHANARAEKEALKAAARERTGHRGYASSVKRKRVDIRLN